MGKVKTTTVSRVIRIPLSIWNKYSLGKGEHLADWYDALDQDIDKEVDGQNAIVIHFRLKEDKK